MAGGIEWFRWHHGSVTDPKFQLVARRSGASLPDVLAVWAYILEQASASADRGCFGDIDCEAVDCMFGFPATENRTADILAAMADRGLLKEGRIAAWDHRQPKREDETAADRKRRQREREHEELVLAVTPEKSRDVTQGHAQVTHGHDRGEESREEKKREEQTESLATAVGADKPRRASKKAPTDFELTDELRSWAVGHVPGIDAAAELERFKDHTFATARSDWHGTFRNWLRKAHKDAAGRPRDRPSDEPEWRRAQRERNEAFLGPAAARRTTKTETAEVIDVTSRLVG